MKILSFRKIFYFSFAALALTGVAVFPQKATLPPIDEAISYGRKELQASVSDKCRVDGNIEYASHRTTQFFGENPDQAAYLIRYDITVRKNEGSAFLLIWGRTNIFREIFLYGKPTPVSDTIGYDVKCGRPKRLPSILFRQPPEVQP
ncbi:hypothetical protein GGD81_004034 [Rhodobium orientis]|uniref:hypothetical protein n=1 Tax=Rhodobium orientis TaxID=34017 RepID=UPI0011B945F6|nr:hypothetical protein [Rhodobium orientis]MBB4304968.1 hypothetical protein [Rhodobium orientis]